MHGLSALESTKSACGEGLYSTEASHDTYASLARAAQTVLAAGYHAIVDACALKRAQRHPLRALARSMNAPVVVVDVQALREVLRARVGGRVGDVPEATVEVLEQQLTEAELIGIDEELTVVTAKAAGPRARSRAS